MSEKQQANSYLNQRMTVSDIKSENVGIQTEILVSPTVKIGSSLAAFANPYSLLTSEYTEEIKTRALSVTYIINSEEFTKQEVKLPNVKVELNNKIKNISNKETVIENIPVIENNQNTTAQMSDIEVLNRLSEYQSAHSARVEDKNSFDLSETMPAFEVEKETTVSNDLDVLNELQANASETSKKSNTKEEINTAMNGLEGLLAELSEEGDSKTLGMG